MHDFSKKPEGVYLNRGKTGKTGKVHAQAEREVFSENSGKDR